MRGFVYVVALILLINYIEGTPLKVRYCLQYGTTSTTNTNNQANQDGADDYEAYDEPADPAEDAVFDKNTSTVVACSRYATFCYALWTIDATKNTTKIVVQGCWELSDKKETCISNECISSKETKSGHYFCCCSGDNCNGNFTYASNPILSDDASIGTESEFTPFAPYTSIWSSPTVYICFAMVGIILMLIIGFLSCRTTTKAVSELAPLAPSGPGYSSNLYNVDNLKLVSMIGQGKYGTVWKGIVNEQHVAVKIFTSQHRQYFLNEKDIYDVPLMESPALLSYFGCDERRTMDDRIEYLLVLSLAPLGCLQDWLTDNRMPFEVFCRMGKSIANGLAHLHTEIRKGDLTKPCICHRDLNSRNILVKADLSCCICDLGFALKTYGPRYECRGEIALAETKSINEVGTLRYMAPEVLEGAVNLRDCESALKQIDVYSLGLVLWELATRCDDFYADESVVPEYKAPYEDEIGANPNFEQMQVLVSRNKARPGFPTNYENSVAARVVKDTCEDCWDHDAEARLTALCVQERIQEITTMNPKAQLHKGQTPPLSTNNLIIATPTTGNHKVSPSAVSFMTPPNQQIIPHINHYGDVNNGLINQPKIVNVPVDTRPKNIPMDLRSHNINDAYIPDEEDKFKSLTSNQEPDVIFSNTRGLPKLDNNESQRKLKGLNSVRAMLQKTFQKSQSYSHKDCDDKSNLVTNSLTYTVNIENYPSDLVNSNTNSLHINMINSADNDIEKRIVERPTNLDLSSGSGRYEHNLIRSANEGSKFKTLADDFTSQPFTMIQSNSPNPKLRIVVSKSANAVKNLNSSRSSLSDPASDVSKLMKRQRSLEVFHEVFGPKGSIERLRNPSQRVKTPGDVPPSVRKVRASKTLSLYDDRMMDTSKLANSV